MKPQKPNQLHIAAKVSGRLGNGSATGSRLTRPSFQNTCIRDKRLWLVVERLSPCGEALPSAREGLGGSSACQAHPWHFFCSYMYQTVQESGPKLEKGNRAGVVVWCLWPGEEDGEEKRAAKMHATNSRLGST